jgi:Domain of unknown function (DUF1772)
MNLLKLSRFVQLISTGLVAGILFGDRWSTSPVRVELPAEAFIQFQQGLHLNMVPLMPILLVLAVLSGILSLWLLRRDSRTWQFRLTLLATLCIAAVLIQTRIIHAPINNELMTWQAATPPPDLREIWSRWEYSHTIRTFVSLLGFAALALVFTSSKLETPNRE